MPSQRKVVCILPLRGAAGDFIYSLTFTDLVSGWTEIRVTWNKATAGIREQLPAHRNPNAFWD